MKRLSTIGMWLVASATTRPGWGHPGHGVTAGDSVAHQMLEPVHSGPWLAAVLTAAAAGWLLMGRLRSKRLAPMPARRRSPATNQGEPEGRRN